MSFTLETQEIVMSLGANVLKFRKRRKLTQKQLADAVGVSFPRISEIENAAEGCNPSIKLVSAIAEALGTTVSVLTREVVAK